MKLAIIGHGGHSKVIQDIVHSNKDYELVGYFDEKYSELIYKEDLFYAPVSYVRKMINLFENLRLIIAIGDNRVRKLIVEKLNLSAEWYATLLHKSAMISPSAVIQQGTVVMPYAVINADSQIGSHSIINTGSVVEHDSVVADFVHVSSHTVLTGAVHLDEGAFIGAGASVIPNIHIGQWSTIGAGATVIQNVPSYCTAVGVPARVKQKHVNGGM